MTLRNPSFDLGTHRATLIGQPFGEIDVPLHWIAWWDSTLSRPEMKVIARTSPYLDPPRICHGTHAVQWFSFYRTHHAGLLQQVSTRPGNVLSLTARAHGWFSQFDDPRLSQYSGTDGLPVTIQDGEPGMELMVGIDPSGGLDPWSEDVVWSIQFWYSGYKSISLTVPASGSQATLYLASKTLHPFKHCDAYFDDVELVVEAGTGDPIPGPDPDGYPARAMVVD